jgi:hypothetical protein
MKKFLFTCSFFLVYSRNMAPVKKRKTRDEQNAERRAKTASQKIKTNLFCSSKGSTLKQIHATVAVMPRFAKGEREQLLPVDDPRQITFWNQQRTKPSQRRLLLVGGGQTSTCNQLQRGLGQLTAKVKAKNKAGGIVKKKETNVERGNNVQKHHMEAEAIQAFMKIPGTEALQVKSSFDGLGVDIMVRLAGTNQPDEWAAVQFKSATYHDGLLSFSHLSREDGDVGGKYENMPIIAIALGDVITPAANIFDSVNVREIQEIFFFSNTTEFPGKVLMPCAWGQHSKPDSYGNHRWVKGRDDNSKLAAMVQQFIHTVQNARKYSYNDICFTCGPGTPNVNINPNKKKEMEQIFTLAASLMPLGFNIEAPWRQNETVDIILRRGGLQRTVSLKSASNANDGSNLTFDKGVHPRYEHCDLVVVFLYDQVEANSHEVHVFSGHHVYVEKDTKTFYWNNRGLYPVYDIRSPEFVARLTL